MEAKYKIGDKVKITLEGFKEKYPKVYTIKEVRKTYENIFIYKLNGVPNWGLESMIKLASNEERD